MATNLLPVASNSTVGVCLFTTDGRGSSPARETADAASGEGTVVSTNDPLGDGVYQFADAAPVVTTQPESVAAVAGDTVVLTAAASGYPAPRVVWQRSSGDEWVDVAGAVTSSLEITELVEGEYSLRAEFTNRRGVVVTEVAV